MQSIIVATDLSLAANNATLYAIRTAQITKSELILFYLFKPVVAEPTSSDIAVINKEQALIIKERLDEYAAMIYDVYDISIEVVVRIGDFMNEVDLVAKEYNSSLLIWGMPETSFEDHLMSETLSDNINRLHLPILTIPEAATFKGIHNLLFTKNALHDENEENRLLLNEYAQLFEANIQEHSICNTYQLTESNASIESQQDVSSLNEINAEKIINAIHKEAKQNSADIIIIPNNEFWYDLLKQTHTRNLVSNSNFPLLCLPN